MAGEFCFIRSSLKEGAFYSSITSGMSRTYRRSSNSGLSQAAWGYFLLLLNFNLTFNNTISINLLTRSRPRR